MRTRARAYACARSYIYGRMRNIAAQHLVVLFVFSKHAPYFTLDSIIGFGILTTKNLAVSTRFSFP